MAEFPIMQLRVGQLLVDTRHMTGAEFGYYCRILFTMWVQGAKLAYDVPQLQRIAGCSARQWRKVGPAVLKPFTIHGGYISQKRLSSTFQAVKDHRYKRALNMQKAREHRSTETKFYLVPKRRPNKDDKPL